MLTLLPRGDGRETRAGKAFFAYERYEEPKVRGFFGAALCCSSASVLRTGEGGTKKSVRLSQTRA